MNADEILARFLPLARTVAAMHAQGQVAVITRDAATPAQPRKNNARLQEVNPAGTLDIMEEASRTTELTDGAVATKNLRLARRGDPITRPVYLPGFETWEQAIGHHDPLTDIFSLGLALASQACGLDLAQIEDLETFLAHRANLFPLVPDLHPVIAKAILRMTELDRHRRAQDLSALIASLEHYRDQDVDFELDLSRIKGFHQKDPRGRRSAILEKLRERLFEISRHNRLIHFRPTLQTLNLTYASVPLRFDPSTIKPEQLLTWRADLRKAVCSGEPLPLGRYLRFEDQPYLPGVLDKIRAEAQRDAAEFGSAQLRLVICFLRWTNLKEKPHEAFDSPLLLLPVSLMRKKGVRDAYTLTFLSSEAEVNPALRFHLRDLYGIRLPETIDLEQTDLDVFYDALAAQIQASEPGVMLNKIDRPQVELIHDKARRRLDDYQRRLRPGARSYLDLDYSYAREGFQPLGVKLFQTKVRPARIPLADIITITRPRNVAERERSLAIIREGGERNPYVWDFDICALTLGNFRYRKMSLVRDYDQLLGEEREHPAFDAVFSLSGRSDAPAPPPLPPEESFHVVPCDPTQGSAIAAARSGRSLIIQGPPGTGKSQTITNLVADYAARGQRVLFVCAKRAAIDVVYHRLRQSGLQDLCCLIHDAQTDKKAFIMELKEGYEKAVGMPAEQRADGGRQRDETLAALRRELDPLARFDEAMRGLPANAGVALRGLIDRLLELRPVRREAPPYGLWVEHRAAIERFVAAAPGFWRHPLRHLHPAVEGVAAVVERLRQAQALASQLPLETRSEARRRIGQAVRMKPLAERGLLPLLDAASEPSRLLAERVQALAAAREGAKGWRAKLSQAETTAALAQARALSGAFAWLRPSWWRLRRVLKDRYDFASSAIKPSWTQVLEALDREHRAAQACDYGMDVAELVALVDGLRREQAPAQAAPLAALEGVPERLDAELAALLAEPGDAIPALLQQLGAIEDALDELSDILPALAHLAALPEPLACGFRAHPPEELESAMAQRSLDEALRDPALTGLNGRKRQEHVRRIGDLVRRGYAINSDYIADRVRQRFYDHVALSQTSVTQLTEAQRESKRRYAAGRRNLEHEFGKTMRYKSIRDLWTGETGEVIQDLKPVWLMSPLSVSDALPLDASRFDVVIFDEASQITLEEAVPALFRASQAIIVGDQMQLPPTNFFSARRTEDESLVLELDDQGSLLSHAARNLDSTMLGWHYRSRSESLIGYSNAAFYQGRLMTIPDPNLPRPDLGEARGVEGLLARPVSFHLLERGIYQERRNPAEAEYIAQLVRGLLPTRLSLGVVAFSEAQQGEIESALERLAQEDAAFRDALEAEYERELDGQFVGLLVKNLENIQGDERDVILLSVCYGKGPDGRMRMNFGPINQSGGERRLNVAFSRAKRHMAVISSIREGDITNDYNDGARCLRQYLRYSAAMSSGDLAGARLVLAEMAARREEARAERHPDPLARQIKAALRSRGLEVDVGVGQSHFRCDLAVRRPGEHAYRLGILTDSEEHYRAADLLSRDLMKPELLRAFGWRVFPVIAKDWLEDRDEVLARIERELAGDDEDETVPPPVVAEAPADGPPSAESARSDAGRHLEFVAGASAKFWEIAVDGASHTVRFGRIGGAGQTIIKSFADETAARADAERLVREKLAKGYRDAGG